MASPDTRPQAPAASPAIATTDAGKPPGYGTSSELRQLLDGVSVLLREEPQHHWDNDPDLRLASEAVADHLYRPAPPTPTAPSATRPAPPSASPAQRDKSWKVGLTSTHTASWPAGHSDRPAFHHADIRKRARYPAHPEHRPHSWATVGM